MAKTDLGIWEVVGGGDKGGILVREGVDLKSKELSSRLSTGALLEVLELKGERLHFRRLTGTGPEQGWVSLKIKGKDLVTKSEKKPPPKFDPYGLLGIEHDATDATIKSAFRKASVKVHPDRCPDDPEAAKKFQELTDAKEFLLNPLKRRFYNLKHKLLKPIVNVAWWAEWFQIFDEIDANTYEDDDGDTKSGSLPRPGPTTAPDVGDSRIDIVIMGATGLAGTLACKMMHILRSGRTWAIAGRDGQKLECLQEKFGHGPFFRGCTRVETPADLESLAKTARVVCDFSGPKNLVGTVMAEACVAAGTHYVEVTAECTACRALQDKTDTRAKEAGVCIVAAGGVNCCAQDMGTWYIVKYLRDKFNVPTRRVDTYVHGQGTTPSGSTIAAGAAMDVNKVLADIKARGGPFFLGGVRPGGVRKEDEDQDDAEIDKYTGAWATCGNRDPNQFHVRCSCGLFDATQPYGDQFLFKAWALHLDKASADNTKFAIEYTKRYYNKMIEEKKIPPVGSGPSERLRQEAFVTYVIVAEADEATDDPRKAYLIMNAGPGGAGDSFEGAAICVTEVACTILDAIDSGLADTGLRPGYGTPAYHLAHLGFMERLQARGFRLKVVDGPPSKDFFRNLYQSTMPIGDAPE